MKVAVFGRRMVIQKILDSLGGNGFEVAVAPEEPDIGAVLSQIGYYDMVIVDSLADGAEATCQYLEELQAIPFVLMVKGRQVDWRKLQPFDAQGYIYEGAGKEEIAARIRAIMRRLKPAEKLEQVTFTCVPEKQMA